VREVQRGSFPRDGSEYQGRMCKMGFHGKDWKWIVGDQMAGIGGKGGKGGGGRGRTTLGSILSMALFAASTLFAFSIQFWKVNRFWRAGLEKETFPLSTSLN
jgi:hypothetical protein